MGGGLASARYRTPAYVWMTGAVALLVLLILAFGVARTQGEHGFFGPSDPQFFRAVTHDPLGNGHTLRTVGRAEASYRYGRIGMPIVAWVSTAGRPNLAGWGLIVVNLLALAAIPLLAADLLARRKADGRLAMLTLLTPGLLLLYDRPYAEPLAIGLILLALILDGAGHERAAVAVLAFAVCTRELAALAVVAFFVYDWLNRNRPWRWLWALAPYAVWVTWVRLRVGEFPFLAHTMTRRDALRFPFVGMAQTLAQHPSDGRASVAVALATAGIAGWVGWRARREMLGVLTLVFAALPLCLGPNTLRYLGDTLRIVAVPQVFAIVCVIWLATHDRVVAPADVHAPAPA